MNDRTRADALLRALSGRSSPGSAVSSGAEQGAGKGTEQRPSDPTANDRGSSSNSDNVRQSGTESGRGSDAIQRAMVFANTVASVRAIGRLLRSRGINSLEYHKEMSMDERAAAIGSFEERGGVLVCTDAGARGIDIHDVTHVIQVGVMQQT